MLEAIPADEFTGEPVFINSPTRAMGNGSLGFYVQCDDEVYRVPDGVRELYMQNRQCGDWYAEIKANHCHVSRCGPTKSEALIAVVTAVENTNASA